MQYFLNINSTFQILLSKEKRQARTTDAQINATIVLRSMTLSTAVYGFTLRHFMSLMKQCKLLLLSYLQLSTHYGYDVNSANGRRTRTKCIVPRTVDEQILHRYLRLCMKWSRTMGAWVRANRGIHGLQLARVLTDERKSHGAGNYSL